MGNFVVSTPVLRGLRARFPDAVIGFIGSQLTADFERALPSLDWRCSWDDPSAGSGLRLQQILAERCRCHGPVQLALNLDGFNPLTCSLVPSLEPVYVAGGTLALIDAVIFPGGSIRVSASWGILIGTALLSSVMPMCSAATTSLNCFASSLGCTTMWTPQP